jgi:hypothetical protein
MNHIFQEKHKCIYIFLFVYAIPFLLLIGCEKKPKLFDVNMDVLERWSRTPLPDDDKERLSSAINKYNNKIVDPVPILIRATLDKLSEPEEFLLGLVILDEDKDLLGFVIREESKYPNGTVTTLEEKYPVFAHYPGFIVANQYGFYISARKGEQRMDEKAWDDYLKMDFVAQVNHLIPPSSSVDSNSVDWMSDDIDTKTYDKVYKLWRSSLPTIFISIPNSDNLNVSIYVYDRAGNKSNTVELEIYSE